jgi:hypothetical protein
MKPDYEFKSGPAAKKVANRYFQAAVIGDVFNLPKPGSKVKEVAIGVGQDPTAWVKFEDGSSIVGHVDEGDVAALTGISSEFLAKMHDHLYDRNLSPYLHKFGARVADRYLGSTSREDGRSGDPTLRGEAMHRRVAQRWLRRMAAKKITDKTPIEGWEEYQKTQPVKAVQMDEDFEVATLEGIMQGHKGDYLAEGPEGERWPIKESIFDKTYKKVAKRWFRRRITAHQNMMNRRCGYSDR